LRAGVTFAVAQLCRCWTFLLLLVTMGTSTDLADSSQRIAKTIYLIRHAQSEENRRLASMKQAVRDVSNLSLPNSSDVSAAMGWFNIPAQLDSAVSGLGQNQILEMAEILKEADFLNKAVIQLVVHSPLQRARDTCLGILNCSAPDHVAVPVKRVVELDLLKEQSVTEIMITQKAFQQRLKQFEEWLDLQPEETIVLVGHSLFFRSLLNLSFKFGNCDVWKVNFDGQRKEKDFADALPVKWSNLQKLYSCQAAKVEME
jgi:broad specificity phosphatase PhoE